MSCGAKKPSCEKMNTTINADDQKGCWKAQVVSNAHQKRDFRHLNYSKIFHALDLTNPKLN